MGKEAGKAERSKTSEAYPVGIRSKGSKVILEVLLLNISCGVEEDLSRPLGDTVVGESSVVCKIAFKI